MTIVSRVAVRNTSYANFKEVGVVPTTLPPPGNEASRTYGDFFEDGSLSLFTYSNGVYQFWTRLSSGTWSPKPNFTTPIVDPSCVARKGVVADFNEDRKPDILLICQGLDAPPFPGARNRILLSVPGGGYRLGDVGPEVSFHHGGAACDLNGDGHIDYVSTGSPDRPRNPLLVYYGDGRGGFTLVPNHPLTAVLNSSSIECLDVNEDGLLDIVTGGNEQDGLGTATAILYGTPSGAFVRQVIPAVADRGGVTDFTVTGTGVNRTLWVSRTGGASSSFYIGRVLQRVNLKTLESTLAVNDAAPWVVWFIPYTRAGTDFIGSDRLEDAIEVIRKP
ncbi:MAG: VCBS repeat-containing protein [Gemmatimonas sp.]